MTPGARVAAKIEVLDAVLLGVPAEKALTNWGRNNRLRVPRIVPPFATWCFKPFAVVDLLELGLMQARRAGGPSAHCAPMT